MTAVYLSLTALLTVAAFHLVARAGAPRAAARRRFAALVALWLLTAGVAWPATRLPADLAFVLASQLSMAAAALLWLVPAARARRRRHPRAGGPALPEEAR
jgi:hypothetical protein